MALEPGDATALLKRVQFGDDRAMADLMALVYAELRRLAGHLIRGERSGHTLQPTALVHEAYLCLIREDRANLQNKAHFMAVAAQAMRRVLLQYARRRRAGKRIMPDGGDAEPAKNERWEEILAVDEAIRRLAELSPQPARVVELRYFGGLSVEETAEALGVSPRTVKRDWALAKGFLHTELAGSAFE